MELDCAHCKGTIRLNVHRAELIIVLLNFATIIALGVTAYWFQSHGLLLATIAAALAGTLALPVLDKTFLRRWPRYASIDGKPQTH